MNSVTEDIRSKLVTAGIGSTVATAQWFISAVLVDNPKQLIVLRESSATGPSHYMDPATAAFHTDGLQIIVRGKTFKDSWDKAKTISDALPLWGKFTLDGSRYEGIHQRGNILPLSEDREDGLFLWSMNFDVLRVAR